MLPSSTSEGFTSSSSSYDEFLQNGKRIALDDLRRAEDKVKDDDVVNVQFTSGTTGLPKAALLTHRYVSNHSFTSYLTIYQEHTQQRSLRRCADAPHVPRRRLLPTAPISLLWPRIFIPGNYTVCHISFNVRYTTSIMLPSLEQEEYISLR